MKPPYDMAGIERINETMLSLSADRAAMREKWNGEVKDGSFAVALESKIDREKRVPSSVFLNIVAMLAIAIMETAFIRRFVNSLIDMAPSLTFTSFLVFAVFSAAICYLGYRLTKKIFLHFDPARSIKTLGVAVYKTLVDSALIAPSAKVDAVMDKNDGYVMISLRNALIHDQNIFNTAMSELMSPIENPRYILIKKLFWGYNYRLSFKSW